MPPRIKRPCRHKGCAALTNDSSGYCDEHRQQHAGEGWRNYQTGKSRQERGYGRPWEVRRARILQRDKHICQECRRAGIATRASIRRRRWERGAISLRFVHFPAYRCMDRADGFGEHLPGDDQLVQQSSVR